MFTVSLDGGISLRSVTSSNLIDLQTRIRCLMNILLLYSNCSYLKSKSCASITTGRTMIRTACADELIGCAHPAGRHQLNGECAMDWSAARFVPDLIAPRGPLEAASFSLETERPVWCEEASCTV